MRFCTCGWWLMTQEDPCITKDTPVETERFFCHVLMSWCTPMSCQPELESIGSNCEETKVQKVKENEIWILFQYGLLSLGLCMLNVHVTWKQTHLGLLTESIIKMSRLVQMLCAQPQCNFVLNDDLSSSFVMFPPPPPTIAHRKQNSSYALVDWGWWRH